jgi:hypothetical protein
VFFVSENRKNGRGDRPVTAFQQLVKGAFGGTPFPKIEKTIILFVNIV